MIITNNNNVRQDLPDMQSGSDRYPEIKHVNKEIKTEVLDADGKPTGIYRRQTITLQEKVTDMPVDQDLNASDFDLQNLIDAGIDPKNIGNPSQFFIQKSKEQDIISLNDVLRKHYGKFFEKPSDPSSETPPTTPPVIEPTKTE